MIVLDTNYFLRALVRATTPQDVTMAETATVLFRRVQRGEDTYTTTDAVIAEAVFALQRPYGLSRADTAGRLRPLLRLPGCRFSTKRICLSALDLWESSPTISFVDALAATQARRLSEPLATFDRDLAKLASVPIWQPPTDAE